MASSAMLQVFGQPASTDVARVMACLLERQLDFELVRTDTFKRGHKQLPEFVKMRARSKNPRNSCCMLIGSLHQVWFLFPLL
jgi:glutathione S-transferase